MHKHHVIPKHEWKKRFGNLKGVNASDNVVWLTIEQHAEAHKLLYELNSSQFDLCAHKMLCALSRGDTEEVRRLAALEVNRGNQYSKGYKHAPRSEEYLRNMSEKLKKAMIGNKNACGPNKKKKVISQEHKEKIRMGMLSYRRVKSEESRGTQNSIVANDHPE